MSEGPRTPPEADRARSVRSRFADLTAGETRAGASWAMTRRPGGTPRGRRSALIAMLVAALFTLLIVGLTIDPRCLVWLVAGVLLLECASEASTDRGGNTREP